jgi:hypothetical protein
MKATSLLFILVFIGFQTFSQIDENKYYVQFTDKNNSPYSLNEPEEYLSQRAIDRRDKQGISIVENDLPVNPQYLLGVKNKGVTLLNPTKWLNGVTIETDDPSLIPLISALPYVENLYKFPKSKAGYKKSFFEVEKMESLLAQESLYKSGKATIYDYGQAEWQINQINGIPLHESGYDGKGVVIAVLDGGFSGVPEHPVFDSIWANNQILGTKDFVHPGGSVFTESGHGKSVLSTMAANSPGEMIGTAPKADYWLLKSEYVTTENLIEEYNWVSAAEFADSVGADVINSSLSYVDFDMPEWNHSYEDLDGHTAVSTKGADIAVSKGILVVNSAGNSGNSEFPYNGAPADGDSVFSIGAVDAAGDRAGFSSIGPTADGRIRPVVMAMGSGTIVAYGTEVVGPGSGTSYSSPVIAGMSACLIQANPNMKVMQIQAAIKQSGNYSDDPDNYMGWGIPDYELANSIMTTVEKVPDETTSLVRVWPNPFTSGDLTIQFAKELTGKVDVELLSATGSMLKKRTVKLSDNSHTLDLTSGLEALPSGIYFLRVISGEKIEIKRLVKQ